VTPQEKYKIMNGELLDLDGSTIVVFDEELYKLCEKTVVDQIKVGFV